MPSEDKPTSPNSALDDPSLEKDLAPKAFPLVPKLSDDIANTSILRKRCDKISSIESDLPSLAASAVSSVEESPRIRFDPRVWIRVFERPKDEEIWYSREDLAAFQREAVWRIRAHSETQLLPTGTGRMVTTAGCNRLLFSHVALQPEPDDAVEQLRQHIHKILIVDPHDICQKLFMKSWKRLLPKVEVECVSNSDEAQRVLEKKEFDLVLIEERLKLFHRQQSSNVHHASGAALFEVLRPRLSTTLVIGVSSHPKEDAPCWMDADYFWPKPPPPMSESLADDMLQTLLRKRQLV